jgi:hypothetical protein
MSYDLPILLQIELKCEKTHAPFKFNHSWLNERGLQSISDRNWRHFDCNSGESTMKQFVDHLKRVNTEARVSAHNYSQKNKK